MAEDSLRLRLKLKQKQAQALRNKDLQPDQPKVLMRTPDGGTVYELPSGQRGFTSEAYSTTDPEAVARIMEGATGGEVSRAGIYEEAISQRPIASRAATAIQGVPFVGEYADEAVGAVSPQAGAAMRLSQESMRQQRPGQTAALQVGTGLAAAAPLAVAGAPAATGGLIQGVGRGAAIGAGLGAVEGAISGYGAGIGEGRLEETQQRGVVGGILGGVLGAVAPAAGRAIGQVGEWFAQRPLKAAAKDLGVSPEVARVIKSIADATDEKEASRILKKMGDDAFLADLSPAARGALDTIMQTHSAAGRVAANEISTRAVGVGSDLSDALDATLGSPAGRSVVRAGIREPARDATRAAYEVAYRTPIDYASEQGRAVEELVSRIPPRRLAAAVADANDMLRYNGIDADQILLRASDDGTITEIPMMNVAQLDYLKRAFDKVKQAGTDPITGKVSPEGAFAGKVARDIRDATRAASPAYAEALTLSAGTLSQEAANDFGHKLLRAQVTRDMARREIAGMTTAEKSAAAQGVRTYIDDTLANVRRTITDPDVDVRKVQKLVGDLSSDASRKKLVTLLGANKARRVTDQLDRSAIALNLRAATIANSRTFGRQVTQEAIDAAAEGSPILKSIMGGSPIQSGREVVKAMTGATDAALEARKSGLYADVAAALVNIRGENAKKALQLMKKLDVQQPIPRARAETIAKALRPFFVAAQQQMTRTYTGGLQ